MIDLKEVSGLSVFLEGTSLIFGKDVPPVTPSARTMEEMKSFLMNTNAEFPKPVIYYMYRGVGPSNDLEILSRNHLRYDLTVIESGKIGREFVKTVGHYHPYKPGTRVRYPEIYQILYGRAVFVLQRIGADESRVEDTYLVMASAPEKVVMPPGCGHVTVNIGDKPLVMANIVSDQFSSLYDTYRRLKGAVCYIVDQDGKPTPRLNKLYGSPPKQKGLKPKHNFLQLSEELHLYTAGTRHPERFAWLNSPEDYQEELKIEKLFDRMPT